MSWPNSSSKANGDDPFIAVDFHGTVYGQQSIGANKQSDNRWDREGIIWFFIFVPRNTDFSEASGAAKAIANIFRGLTLLSGSLEFRDATIGTGAAATEDGAWFNVPVSIEWRFIDAN